MTFGQLIEYNMRSIFIENHSKNVMKKLAPDRFIKNRNWAYLWINSLMFYKFVIIIYHVDGYQNILKLSCRPIGITSYKACFFKKKRCETSLHTSFSAYFFLKKYLSCYNLLNVWTSFSGCICETLSNMSIVFVWYPGCDTIDFEIDLIFPVKLFFLDDQKVKIKI